MIVMKGRLIIELLVIIVLVLTTSSCNSRNEQRPPEEEVTETAEPENTQLQKKSIDFDINSIPVSTVALGDIPFFNLPEGIQYMSKPLQRSYDEIYFPLGDSGKLELIAGSSFKADFITTDNGEWTQAYFRKSYEEAILSVGGVQVFRGRLTPKQIAFMRENASYLGEEGSLDFYNNPITSYVVRRPDNGDIYIQMDEAAGAIQIVRKEPFVQTITLTKEDQIRKDLEETGKSVLHISFDTDKATLKPEGSEAIREIIKALQNDGDLRIAINGYTDNTGSVDHNLRLSIDRAETVRDEIVKAGIAADRLSANGFGQSTPIADNSTEEGKAQNRRVELIRQ